MTELENKCNQYVYNELKLHCLYLARYLLFVVVEDQEDWAEGRTDDLGSVHRWLLHQRSKK